MYVLFTIVEEDACSVSSCEDVCSFDSESQAVCGCRSFGTLTLAEDGITCTGVTLADVVEITLNALNMLSDVYFLPPSIK